MADRDEMNLNLTSNLGDIQLATNQLGESLDAFSEHVRKQYGKTRISGDIISNTDSNTMTTMDTDISSLIEALSTSVSNLNETEDIDPKILKELSSKLEGYANTLRDIRSTEYKVLSADSGRLKSKDYSAGLNEDISSYKDTYSNDVSLARQTMKDLKAIITRSNNALDKGQVSSTFNEDLQNRFRATLGDKGSVGVTKDIFQRHIQDRELQVFKLQQSIDERKNNIKNGNYAVNEILDVRKNISEDEKRIHDLLLYNRKETELMEDILNLQADATNSQMIYSEQTESGGIHVKASKYSLKGILQQHAFRLVGSVGFNIGATLQNAMYKGNQLRTSAYNNGVGGTMINLANNGNSSKRLDNQILKGITNIGLETGTNGQDMARFLGSYTSTNRTGNISDYRKQLRGISEFSAYTGVGSEATNELVSAIGLAGGLNPSSNLKTLYGSLMSSNMVSKAPEQTQALATMINATSNIGNISTSNINSMVGVQQQMASTKNSALQGQQGANAYTAVSEVMSDTNSTLMRNIYSDIFGLDAGDKKQNAELTYKMENVKKDPALMTKGIKRLQKYFNNSKEQTAEYLAEHSGGKLSTHQAMKMVDLVDKGKLSEKELKKITKSDRKKTEDSPLQKALKGSGQFTMNFYLAVDQRNDTDSSMVFDTLRGAKAQTFQNHPILGMVAQAGGSAAYNLAIDSISGAVQNAIEGWGDNHKSKRKSKDTNNHKGGSIKGSSETAETEDNSHKRTQHIEEEKQGKHYRSKGGKHYEKHKPKTKHKLNIKGFGKDLLLNVAGSIVLDGIGNAINNVAEKHEENSEAKADTVSSSAKKKSKSTYDSSSYEQSKTTKKSSKFKDNSLDNRRRTVWEKAIHVAEMAKTVPQLIHPSESSSSNDGNGVGSITGINSKGVQALRDIAKKVGEKTGIKAEFIFAQIMHETGGNLNGQVASKDNNYGGVQYSQGMPTYGVDITPGTIVGDGAAAGTGHYAHFKSANDFATYYANFLNAQYSDLKNAKTVEEYAQILKNHHYYEDSVSNYVAGMNRFIGQYNSKAYGGFYTSSDKRSIPELQAKIDDDLASYTGRRGFSGSSAETGTLMMLQAKVREHEDMDDMSLLLSQDNIHVEPKYNVNAQINNSKYPKEDFINSIQRALNEHTNVLKQQL